MSYVGSRSVINYEVVPVLDTNAYSAGDVLAVPIEVPDFWSPLNQAILLQSVSVIDEADQAADFDILFFNTEVTLGTLNAAVSISDTDVRQFTGVVSVAAADYIDLIASQVAQPQFNPLVLRAANNATFSMYLGLVARGAATYGASSLRLQLGVIR